MIKYLLFCHGWGGTVNFWNNLRVYFNNAIINQALQINKIYYLDLNYLTIKDRSSKFHYGSQEVNDKEFHHICSLPQFKQQYNLTKNVQLFGIGHSLGLMKLLTANLNFSGIIGLQGFTNFLGNNQKLQDFRITALSKLIQNFMCNPQQTLEEFYNLLAIEVKLNFANINLNTKELLKDLYFLTKIHNENDLKSINIMNIPGLIVGAQDDLIVPPAIIMDNFRPYQNFSINILPTGGHGLGYKYANIIYQQIINFLISAMRS